MRRTDNCQRFILQPALAQINAVTSLAVSYETLKEGRKIVGFMFNIKTKTKKAVKKEKKPAAAVEFSSRLEIELFKQLQQVRPAVTQEEVLQQAKLEGVSVIQMLEFLKKQQELL
jgi:plasmid replication initiation protein